MEALGALVVLLVVVALAVLAYRLGSPAAIGGRGERRVISFLDMELPPGEYRAFHDITLPTPYGPTQIDHVIVSPYGVFVIETKNYTGWIFGDYRSKQWTQVIYRTKNRFKNPLHQNFKHTKAVESFLSLSSRCVHSVVVFVGDAEFKTQLPRNVIRLSELRPYILSHQHALLSASDVGAIVAKMRDYTERRELPPVSS